MSTTRDASESLQELVENHEDLSASELLEHAGYESIERDDSYTVIDSESGDVVAVYGSQKEFLADLSSEDKYGFFENEDSIVIFSSRPGDRGIESDSAYNLESMH